MYVRRLLRITVVKKCFVCRLYGFVKAVDSNLVAGGRFIKCEKSGSKGEILSIFARKNENKILE